ncbi:Velvet factor [Geosmithia morbida]|uniref:Velvet factor n=1 Tax=Geosmithia morbida TaxID=1094350 RepID=A0A9P4Z063_9HYPO|nr:Velvet factor [Geosmithia morbida]KAF4124229.1 Velvet factor [Geosmithia morbida]
MYRSRSTPAFTFFGTRVSPSRSLARSCTNRSDRRIAAAAAAAAAVAAASFQSDLLLSLPTSLSPPFHTHLPPARQFNPPGGAEPPRTPSFSPSAAAAAAAAPQIRVSRIPNLLDGEKQAAIEGITFRLRMRQNPKAARACGSGERDRRNVDPPPIVQLHVEAPGLRAEEIDTYLRYEGYVMNCWIYDQTGTHDASNMPSEYRYQRRLTGSLVGTPFYGKDELGQEGCFFPFPDLSVRTLGKYRLKFTLIMLNVSRPGQARHFPILAETFSNVFEVYAVKDFPGICESSKLVRALRQQGCVISIKKGNDKKKKRDVPDPPDDDDGDGDGDDYDDNDDDGDGADGSRFGVKRQRSNATG